MTRILRRSPYLSTCFPHTHTRLRCSRPYARPGCGDETATVGVQLRRCGNRTGGSRGVSSSSGTGFWGHSTAGHGPRPLRLTSLYSRSRGICRRQEAGDPVAGKIDGKQDTMCQNSAARPLHSSANTGTSSLFSASPAGHLMRALSTRHRLPRPTCPVPSPLPLPPCRYLCRSPFFRSAAAEAVCAVFAPLFYNNTTCVPNSVP